MLTNLLNETMEILKQNGREKQEIIAVADSFTHKYIPWDEFEWIARNTDYDNGYGREEINANLIILGQDWWLERYIYDGAEWWEYKEIPKLKDFKVADEDIVIHNLPF